MSVPSDVEQWLVQHDLADLVEPLGNPRIGIRTLADLRYVDEVEDLSGCDKMLLRRFREAVRGECDSHYTRLVFVSFAYSFVSFACPPHVLIGAAQSSSRKVIDSRQRCVCTPLSHLGDSLLYVCLRGECT